MSNLKKKFVAIVTILTLSVLVSPGIAQALTAEELQVQITALLAQLSALQAQLTTLEAAPAAAPAACTGITFDRNLKVGMSGNDVKCLQTLLNQDAATKVAETGVGSSGNETTYFGNLTKAAVVKFQEKYAADCLTPLGLTTGTGFVGVKTRAKLNSLLAAPSVVCGNGTCETGETTATCPADCPAGVVCGNGTCETGETTATCPADCPAVTPVTTKAEVLLAADTPAAAQVAKNAQDAIFTKLKFTAGSDAYTISKIIVARGGVSADADIASIKLYDGVTQVGSTQALNTLTHKATFSGLSWSIPAGETKTLTIKASVASGATAGDSVRLGISLAADITSTVTLEGTFPIWGEPKTVAGISVGVLDVDVQASPAAATILSGAVDQEIAAWRFYASTTEGFAVHQITVTHIGSATRDDVKNIKLKVSGVQIGSTIASLDSQNKATFDLSSAPLSINAATGKTIYAYADVASGIWTSRTIKFEITQYTDVVAYGANSGGATTITASNATYSKQTGATMTVGQGTLTVAADASLNPASQEYVKGTTDRLFSAFKFTTGAREGVRVPKLRLLLSGSGSATDISNVTLWDGTTQIAGPGSVIGSYVTFGENTIGYDATGLFDVGKSTVKTIQVKADIPSGATTNNTLKLSIGAITDIWIDGLDSKYDIEQNTTNITLTSGGALGGLHTVKASGTLVASLSAQTPSAQTYVIGSTEKEFTRINLTAGSGEDILVSAILIDIYSNVAGGNTATSGAKLINVKLVNAADGVQYGSTVAAPTASASFSGNLTVPAASTVTLKAIADIPTSSYPVPDAKIKLGGTAIATALDSTGAYSAATIVETGSATGNTITIGAGSLTVAAAPSPSDQTVIIGSTEVSYAGFTLTAGTAEDIRVTFLRFWVSTSEESAATDFSNIALYDGTTRLTAKKPLTDATIDYVAFSASDFLNSSGINITKGQQKTILVKADVPATASSSNNAALGVSSTDDVIFTGLSSNTTPTVTLSPDTATTGPNYDSAGGIANLYEVTLASAGTLTVQNNAGRPVIAIQAVGSEGVVKSGVAFHKVDFAATMEDIYIKQIIVETTGGRDANFSAVTLWDDTTQLGTAQTFVSASSTFNFPAESYWKIPKGGSKTLTVKADLNGIRTVSGSGSETGDAPLIRLHSIDAQGKDSGNDTISGEGIVDLSGNTQYLRQSVPVLAASSLTTTVLTTGEKTLYKWTVTADSKGAIGWRRVAFNITGNLAYGGTTYSIGATSSDVSVDGVYVISSGSSNGSRKVINAFKVWDVTDNLQVTATTTAFDGTALDAAAGAFIRTDVGASSGQNIVFVAGEEQQVAAGATKTYELRGTVLNAPITGDTVLVKIADLSSTATSGDYAIVNRNATNFTREDKAVNGNGATFASTTLSFIWTDRSGASGSATHGLTTSDWTNDYKISGIPTATLSLSK